VSCSPTKKVVIPPPPPGPPEVTITPEAENKEDAFFAGLFNSNRPAFDSILKNRKAWNVQVIYTQVNRTANGVPELTNFYFNRHNAGYFYPASTVKLPVALLALEKLNELNIPGLTKNSTMITEAAFSGQSPVYNDPNTPDGKPSIAQYIKKILLVSDNDAFNRLYEFLGQEQINEALQRKGYKSAQILHRLDIFLTEEENRRTNPVKFYDSSNRLIRSFQEQVNRKAYTKRNDLLGNGYYSNGILQNKPMDFSKKNKLELADLHNMLTSLIFPQAVRSSQRFNITEEDRRFVLQYMSQFPGESVYPSYDTGYHDAYVKFLLYGSEKGSLPKNIRIFNKVGDAYGQLTDVAYIVDFKNNIEFFVSATIYCNEDGILNDDHYDYQKTGFPFMKNLGKVLYDHELLRKKNMLPDLSSLIFSYNK
jgi:beta-lactamase class A